jgi:hypothetical protein
MKTLHSQESAVIVYGFMRQDSLNHACSQVSDSTHLHKFIQSTNMSVSNNCLRIVTYAKLDHWLSGGSHYIH